MTTESILQMNKRFSLTLINVLILLLTAFSMLLWFYLLWRRKIYNIILSRTIILDNYAYFTYLLISTIFILILLLLFLLITLYKRKINKNNKEEKQTFFFKFSLYGLKFYNHINIFYKSYSLIINFFGTGSPYILFLIALAKKMQKFKYKSVAFFIKVVTIVPRMLICIVFILEIYFKQLHYYYYSLFILIIYVFFRFSIFAFDDLYERILPEAEAMLEKNIVAQKFIMPNGKQTLSGIGFIFKPEFADRNLDHFLHTYYYPLLYLDGYLSAYIKPNYIKYSIISRLIYYFIHILGFIYILFYLI